jgi:hypothetical protein
VTQRRACTALLGPIIGLQLGVPALAGAESWPTGDVAAAEEFQREESARAAAYRKRVAEGDVRADAAPQPRSAPEASGRHSASDKLRDSADWVERLERWLEEMEADGLREEPLGEEGPERPERSDEPDDWWAEEERRLERAR